MCARAIACMQVAWQRLPVVTASHRSCRRISSAVAIVVEGLYLFGRLDACGCVHTFTVVHSNRFIAQVSKQTISERACMSSLALTTLVNILSCLVFQMLESDIGEVCRLISHISYGLQRVFRTNKSVICKRAIQKSVLSWLPSG